MQLHQIHAPLGANKRKKIVGRGRGSGHGKRSGRGQKGQGARAGRATMTGYEGGQMNLLRRLAKVGFNSKWPSQYQIVNVEVLERFESGAVVNPQTLRAADVIKSIRKPVKILSDGSLTKKLTVQAHRFSKTAAEKIVKAGGKAEVIEAKK